MIEGEREEEGIVGNGRGSVKNNGEISVMNRDGN